MKNPPSLKRAQSLQIYMKEGIPEDRLMLDVWKSCQKYSRAQNIFRTMLAIGFQVMLESDQIPDKVIEECNLDLLLEKQIRRKQRQNAVKRAAMGEPAADFTAASPVPHPPVVPYPYPVHPGAYGVAPQPYPFPAQPERPPSQQPSEQTAAPVRTPEPSAQPTRAAGDVRQPEPKATEQAISGGNGARATTQADGAQRKKPKFDLM